MCLSLRFVCLHHCCVWSTLCSELFIKNGSHFFMCPHACGFDCTTVVLGILCVGSWFTSNGGPFVFIPVQVLSWALVQVVNYFSGSIVYDVLLCL